MWDSISSLRTAVQLTVDRALVLAVNNAVAAAAPGANPVLQVGGQELASFCHNSRQRAVLALPGRGVAYAVGSITPQQVMTHRPSYVNAILIQSRGVVSSPPCTECSRRGLRPFPECIRLERHFGNCCGNCKWRDHAARCRLPSVESIESSDSEDRPSPSPKPVQKRRRIGGPKRIGLLLGSSDNPVVLDE